MITNLFRRLVKVFTVHILGKKQLLRILNKLLRVSNQNIEDMIDYSYSVKAITGYDLIRIGYKKEGIDDYGDEEHTGELFFLKNELLKIVGSSPLIFDVGANIGNYSRLAKNCYPNAKIYAFEPNPESFKVLNSNRIPDIESFELGFGKLPSVSRIYTNKKISNSEHASLLKDVFLELHKETDIISHVVQISTIDSFCSSHSIDKINFLKIDTEGFEYEVLLGATQMIESGRVEVIQFEFNEMNIISKVFLKDFYALLSPRFNFYRLKRDKLIPLGDYTSFNEIFRYQNLILISKNFS